MNYYFNRLQCMHGVWPLATDIASSVCRLSVGHSNEPYKNGWTDGDAIWVVDLGGPKDHVLGGNPDPPGKGQFLGFSGPLKSIINSEVSKNDQNYNVYDKKCLALAICKCISIELLNCIWDCWTSFLPMCGRRHWHSIVDTAMLEKSTPRRESC